MKIAQLSTLKTILSLLTLLILSCNPPTHVKNQESKNENKLPVLENTHWKLISMQGKEIQDGKNADLHFGPLKGNEMDIHGTCFVNNFFGKVTISGNKLIFGNGGVTQMASMDEELNKLEYAYLQSIRDEVDYKLEHGKLIILSSNKSELVFQQIQ